MEEITSRRFQEKNIYSAIQRQTSQGALYQLIANALLQPQRHLRVAIIELCRRQGFASSAVITALNVMELADWVKTQTDGLEVVISLTEHAKMAAGA